jgi:hypothetical protein
MSSSQYDIQKTGYGKSLANGQRQRGDQCRPICYYHNHLEVFPEDDMFPFPSKIIIVCTVLYFLLLRLIPASLTLNNALLYRLSRTPSAPCLQAIRTFHPGLWDVINADLRDVL